MFTRLKRAVQNTWDEMAILVAAYFGAYVYSQVPVSFLVSPTEHAYAVFVATGSGVIAFAALYVMPRFGK